MDDTDDKAGFSLPVSSFNRTVLPGLRRYKGGAGHGGREPETELPVSSPGPLYGGSADRGTFEPCHIKGSKKPQMVSGA